MVFQHAEVLPEGDEWLYEYSWAGERVFALKDQASARLQGALTRKDLTNRFPGVAAALARLPVATAVMDGVVRAFEPPELQACGETPPSASPTAAPLRLIASDLLWRDEEDLRRLTVRERQQRLADLVRGTGILVATAAPRRAADALAEARRAGAEAVIAKRSESRYRPFARSGDWVRVPVGPKAPRPAAERRDPRGALGFGPGGALGLRHST